MRFPFLLPVWIVLADMIYTFVLNVMQSVASGQKKALPADGLPVSPDIVFSGLQVVANGGMVLCIGFGLLMLLRLDRSVARGKAMPVGVFATQDACLDRRRILGKLSHPGGRRDPEGTPPVGAGDPRVASERDPSGEHACGYPCRGGGDARHYEIGRASCRERV